MTSSNNSIESSNNNTVRLRPIASTEQGSTNPTQLFERIEDRIREITRRKTEKTTNLAYGIHGRASTSDGSDSQSLHIDIPHSPDNVPRSSTETESGLISTLTLQWKDVEYEIPMKKKQVKKILCSVSGKVKPGEMLAIMGSSGAGKSTLLNILAGRVTSGHIRGEILVNRQKRPANWKRLVAYVQQEDALMATLTVRETLTFAALLRLPEYISESLKKKRVEKIINELGLIRCADTLIGDANIRGISGGERKRVAIGIELIANPRLLFLDEPTSGLDAFTSYNIIESTGALALREKKTIVMTIHQPREDILFLFDKILLLSGGKTIYYGTTIGAIWHFYQLGIACPTFMNPADFFIDTITIDDRSPEAQDRTEKTVTELQNAWENLEKKTSKARTISYYDGKRFVPVSDILPAIDILSDEERSQAGKGLKGYRKTWNNGWFKELSILIHRGVIELHRSPLVKAYLFQTVIISLLISFTFFQMGNNQSSIQIRVGVLFFIITNIAFLTLQPIVTAFPLERSIMRRERYAVTYRTSTYFASKLVINLILRIIITLIYGLSIYYIMGLNPSARSFFIFQGILLVFVWATIGLGFLVGISSKTVAMAQIIAPVTLLIFFIYGGNFSPASSIPPELRWLQYLSLIKYGYSAVFQNEFTGLTFVCNNGLPPSASNPCTPGFATGEEVISFYQLNQFPIYTDCLILIGIGFGFLILAYFVMLFKDKPKIKII